MKKLIFAISMILSASAMADVTMIGLHDSYIDGPSVHFASMSSCLKAKKVIHKDLGFEKYVYCIDTKNGDVK